jgi:thiamine-monophosphate kinase
MSEFEIIRRYFQPRRLARTDVVLGIGDDAAILSVDSDREVISIPETLVANRDFDADTDPGDVARLLFSRALSRLAATGAQPAWATLALSVPHPDTGWLEPFSEALLGSAQSAGVALVGGDTTRGPGSLTLIVTGTRPVGQTSESAHAT